MSAKRSSKNNRIYQTAASVFVVIFICAVVWGGYLNSEYNTSSPADNDYLPTELTNFTTLIHVSDEKELLDSSQKELLDSFATKYVYMLCSLETQDVSDLFTEKGENYYLNTAAFDILTEIRKMSHLDLYLTHAEITYNVVDVNRSGDTLTVHITEENIQKFSHLTEASQSRNINHYFVLKERGGTWLIESHRQEEDFFLLAQEAWENAAGSDWQKKAANTVEIIKADAVENKTELSVSTGNPPENLTAAGTSYNRNRAVEYASRWWNERNYTGSYLAYDEYGGNCQNFASQCLYAGGIDMDYNSRYGEWQWKFYSATLNTKRTASGRSYSWTGVDPFYTYVVSNDSTGLVAQADMDLNYAEKGDIIQVGAYHRWRHSLVVTDVVRDENGNTEDIIVASNTADRWNYPLSAYIYTYPRLIHIIGQN